MPYAKEIQPNLELKTDISKMYFLSPSSLILLCPRPEPTIQSRCYGFGDRM